jgi:hypothetical protein
MMVFPILTEHALNVSVQRPHDADAREHCRAARRRHEDQGFHCRLPLLGLVLSLTISPSVFDFMIAIVPLRKPGNVLTQQMNEFVRRTPIDPAAVLLLESIIRLALPR